MKILTIIILISLVIFTGCDWVNNINNTTIGEEPKKSPKLPDMKKMEIVCNEFGIAYYHSIGNDSSYTPVIGDNKFPVACDEYEKLTYYYQQSRIGR